MASINIGVKNVLSNPKVYALSQSLMGAHKFRTSFCAEYVVPSPAMTILDIGCGTADILDYLPNVNYWGFDISQRYIDQAKARFGSRGNFNCGQLRLADLTSLPKFDRVLGLGFLNHVDDCTASETLNLASQALRPGGEVITVDCCLVPQQSRIARFLICNDRGQHVRDRAGYEALMREHLPVFQTDIVHQRWVPYTHCIMKGTRQ
jgi:SAM-dependent methyltransferase